MKNSTLEWVRKAEGDLISAERALRKPSLLCHACFHTYECADKYIEAILNERGARFRFAQPLIEAFGRLERRTPEWSQYRPLARYLNEFNESILYPGRNADQEDAELAISNCRAIREKARAILGLADA